MKLKQSELERLLDQRTQNEPEYEVNVEIIRAERVRLVLGPIPAQVRKALRSAVNAGALGHVAKDGHKPEAFYHPTFEYLVHGERAKHERDTLHAMASALGGVVARPMEVDL